MNRRTLGALLLLALALFLFIAPMFAFAKPAPSTRQSLQPPPGVSAATYQRQLLYIQRHRVSPQKAARILKAVYRASREYRVPVRLLLAMVKKESTFKANAASKDGSKGLIQVRVRVHRKRMAQMGVHNIFHVEGNLRVGASIYASYLKRARGDTRKALTRYSGGSTKYAHVVTRIYNSVPA